MPPGGPAGVGRPRGGADAALDARKAGEAGAGGGGVRGWPVPRSLGGQPAGGEFARRKCCLDPCLCGGGGSRCL